MQLLSRFLAWLLKPQGRILKLQITITMLAILIAIGFHIRDRSVLARRDSAYQQIRVAAEKSNHLEVLKNAEIFFENVPLSRKDGRTQQVMNLYSEAFVRWFVQQPEDKRQEADVKTRIDRYRTAMKTSEGK